MHASTEIDVKSTLLKDTLLEIFAGVDGLDLNKTPPMVSPELLFYAREPLFSRKEEEKKKDEPNQNLINDIGTALRFIQEDFGGLLQNLDSLLEKGEITFDLLWTIFPPKTLVIATNHGLTHQPQALNLTSASYGKQENGARYYQVCGNIITHDGEDFGYGSLDINIDQFEGAKSLTALSVFPFKYHQDHENLRKDLIARGRKYLSLIREGNVCQEYTFTFGLKGTEMPNGKTKTTKANLQGRAMIDPEAYRSSVDSSTLARPWVYPANWITGENMNLNEDQLLICASFINGFSLAHKTWGQFFVSGLQDISWNEDAFSKLVINDTRRKLIHALVRSHRQDDASFDDIIENKGKGLVGLLSGSPGVGKTLTAEAVAEVTRRPLYQVSTGELGIDADIVDQRLGQILEISRRWGCVLLIDEADVFLATRGVDLARDTLVSIFLRRLEYFRGVLILTTNRKSEIDPAFQSRIHFSLHYPDLNEESRKAVWSNFIDTVAKQNGKAVISPDDISKLAKYDLNGRQVRDLISFVYSAVAIKNAVSCAVSISREENEPLTLEHIEMILGIINL
ncbi:AAA family ATPase protein [Rutstroemia sp. NJR-2017a WRK4]|nr:AAA family ATPase protein [Rutstroemia sp. NJR-2017a WRK4]